MSYQFLISHFLKTKYFVYLNEDKEFGIGSYILIFSIIILFIYKYNLIIKQCRFSKVVLLSMTALPICIIYSYYFPIFYRVMLLLLQFAYVLIAIGLQNLRFKKIYSLYSMFAFCIFYGYFFIRAYRFLTIEIDYIGVPYISVLFS